MKLSFYGDSILYGWDPRLGAEEQLADSVRLIPRLGKAFSAEIREDTLPGRCIPDITRFLNVLQQNRDADLLFLMLGTNDLLQGRSPENAAERWHNLLKEDFPFVLCVPPVFRGGGERIHRLSDAYRALARVHGCGFLDLSGMDIPCFFDGIHPNEEGQQVMFACFRDYIRDWKAGKTT